MLKSSASTAFRIKQCVSNTKFYIVTETYGVEKNVTKPKKITKFLLQNKE